MTQEVKAYQLRLIEIEEEPLLVKWAKWLWHKLTGREKQWKGEP